MAWKPLEAWGIFASPDLMLMHECIACKSALCHWLRLEAHAELHQHQQSGDGHATTRVPQECLWPLLYMMAVLVGEDETATGVCFLGQPAEAFKEAE